SRDVFVAKLAGTDGSHLMSARFGSSFTDTLVSLSADPVGGVGVTMYTVGPIDFGSGPIPGIGAVVATFDGALSPVWARRQEGTLVDAGFGAMDASGELFVGGSFVGWADVGGPTLIGIDLDTSNSA